MRTGYVWHPLMAWHDTGSSAGLFAAAPLDGVQPGEHFEHPDTKRRLHELVESSGLIKNLTPLEPEYVSREQLARVHEEPYLDWLKHASEHGGGQLDASSPFGRQSFPIARLAAGGTLAAVHAVLDGTVDNAYALVRPPGHHAAPAKGMGFCLLNNIAIAAADVLAHGLVERVTVVDFDVHHGNGTQAAFYRDPRVLTISLHQDSNYPPNSGRIEENGDGPGRGTAINIPLPAGSGHGAYLAAFERVVLPALSRNHPDLILVASGFDASAGDPLGRQMLSSETYRKITRMLMGAADELCEGALVMSHEGGYNPNTAVPWPRRHRDHGGHAHGRVRSLREGALAHGRPRTTATPG